MRSLPIDSQRLEPLSPTENFTPRIYTYNQGRYNFPRLLRELFGSQLETLGTNSDTDILRCDTDQTTIFHQCYYERFHEKVRPTYLRFIGDVIAPLFGEPFCYQAIPTFRIHLPNNVAVGEFHTDGDYNHPVGEVNFWLPFTRAFATNSIWLESSRESGDFRAQQVEVGEVLVFDAVRWRHGNRVNLTGQTRASFDFRCITMSLYRPTGARTVSAGQPLEIGHYYAVLP